MLLNTTRSSIWLFEKQRTNLQIVINKYKYLSLSLSLYIRATNRSNSVSSLRFFFVVNRSFIRLNSKTTKHQDLHVSSSSSSSSSRAILFLLSLFFLSLGRKQHQLMIMSYRIIWCFVFSLIKIDLAKVLHLRQIFNERDAAQHRDFSRYRRASAPSMSCAGHRQVAFSHIAIDAGVRRVTVTKIRAQKSTVQRLVKNDFEGLVSATRHVRLSP